MWGGMGEYGEPRESAAQRTLRPMLYAVDYEGHSFHDDGKRYTTVEEATKARDEIRAQGWHDASLVVLEG